MSAQTFSCRFALAAACTAFLSTSVSGVASGFDGTLTEQSVYEITLAQYQVLDEAERDETSRRVPLSQRTPRVPGAVSEDAEKTQGDVDPERDSEDEVLDTIAPDQQVTVDLEREANELPGAVAPLENPALSDAPSAVEEATANEVDPEYTITIFKSSGGRLSVQGSVPDERTQAKLATAIGGFGAFDEVSLDAAAPENFSNSLFSGIEALALLDSGRLVFASGEWALSGYAASEAQRDFAMAVLQDEAATAQWRFAITAPKASEQCSQAVERYMADKDMVFASASYRLTAASEAWLPGLVEQLSLCPNAPVYVEGHTDSDGNPASNLTLSVMRAETVVDALIDLGVAPSRLYAVGYGDSLPVASNATADGKRQNRRIVFRFEDAAAQ